MLTEMFNTDSCSFEVKFPRVGLRTSFIACMYVPQITFYLDVTREKDMYPQNLEPINNSNVQYTFPTPRLIAVP